MAKTGQRDEPIQALLKEGRKFPPPKEFTRAARVKSPAIYKEPKANPLRFWEAGQRAAVDEALEEDAGVEAALREVVRRRQAQRLRQLPRSARRGPAPQQG